MNFLRWAHSRCEPKPAGWLSTVRSPLRAANLHSRIASRILWQVGRRGYITEQHLYDATQEVRWQDLMSAQQTLRVDVTASRSPLQSLEFAMLRIKDGIVDRLRDLPARAHRSIA